MLKAWKNNHENKASVWTVFKSSFTWLTSIKNRLFTFMYYFFGYDHFFNPWDLKKGPEKKSRQWKKIIWFMPYFFTVFFSKIWGVISKFWLAFSKKLFWLKSLQMVGSKTGEMSVENQQPYSNSIACLKGNSFETFRQQLEASD